jgi:uncharacterized tellurite resistance protein B-like protein
MSHKLLRTLLHLAQADGTVSGSELALIYKIGVEKGIPMFEVEQIIQNPPQEPEDLSELSEEDKFEYLYTVVLMMKMDGILDERESMMCARYAAALGYKEAVIPSLNDLIESDHELSDNKDALKLEVQKFMI